jgi:6-pyruvoyltetrahydropterin/6-carboxytetrahydropterin synthase
MLLDFGQLKAICDTVLAPMDHQLLNELPPFDTENATSENLARHIFGQVGQALSGGTARVKSVRVWETPGQSVIYKEG